MPDLWRVGATATGASPRPLTAWPSRVTLAERDVTDNALVIFGDQRQFGDEFPALTHRSNQCDFGRRAELGEERCGHDLVDRVEVVRPLRTNRDRVSGHLFVIPCRQVPDRLATQIGLSQLVDRHGLRARCRRARSCAKPSLHT